MFIIRDLCVVYDHSHPGVRHIVAHRITQLQLSVEETLSNLGEFNIVFLVA
jgi:hypothetical protein